MADGRNEHEAEQRIASLPSLGPVTERQLAEVGVTSVAELRALGAVEAWRRLKFAFPRRISLVGLYALEAALRGIPWTALGEADRAALRAAATR